ncbi:nucleotidyltransferase [Macrococcus equipercicus]|uniref:tRNA(Met) cytidine acetate ligase n=1 Tax=Macrococcus equipercicus TaxID=69967 RepID=A0A9Q9BRW2_9STAP|nr:nucleotidyltransferase [Macrococcus equipercicus]KAA1042700.1 nucleotidyltransferase [Macrococcus equipercicus]UTH14566.1 nucleotidyltransferase [Macrococcus equipercicus]
MKSVAIISEYNPFHNGHAYQAELAREQTGADVVIAIMSGQFTQRGEPAIVNKFIRAEMALSACDLIVELPQFYALSYANDFASGGIQAAKLLRADALSFGAEEPDIDKLTAAVDLLTEPSAVDRGKSYAMMMGEEQRDYFSPNNILAMQYMKAARQINPGLQLVPVQRIDSSYHDTEINGRIASATAIRRAALQHEDVTRTVPSWTGRLLLSEQLLQWEQFFEILKYRLLTSSTDELRAIYMMTEGLENLLKKHIVEAATFSDFMSRIKTKRYTYTRLQRLLCYVLLNIKTSERYPEVSAVRVLAMNDKGRRYLKTLPGEHYYTMTNKKNAPLFHLEIKATRLHNLISGSGMTDFNTPVIYRS